MKRILIPALLLMRWVPAPAAELPVHAEVRQVMGTLATVQVWADDEATAAAATDSAFLVLTAVDSLLSTWNGNSALSRLNAAPAGSWVTVGAEACHVLRAARDIAGRTGGAFDPTVLPLVRLWGFRDGDPAQPDSLDLAAVLAAVNWEALEVGAERARLRRPGMAVDLGGIAKGHALDRAAQAMVRAGAAGGVLDLGGNLLVFGRGPAEDVGVVAPDDPDALAFTVPLDRGAVATSGQYERFATIAGRTYGHILDPRSGRPVQPGISATVVAPNAMWADALATAVVVMGRRAGLALLEEFPAIEGAVVTATEIHVTSGWTATRPEAPRSPGEITAGKTGGLIPSTWARQLHERPQKGQIIPNCAPCARIGGRHRAFCKAHEEPSFLARATVRGHLPAGCPADTGADARGDASADDTGNPALHRTRR